MREVSQGAGRDIVHGTQLDEIISRFAGESSTSLFFSLSLSKPLIKTRKGGREWSLFILFAVYGKVGNLGSSFGHTLTRIELIEFLVFVGKRNRERLDEEDLRRWLGIWKVELFLFEPIGQRLFSDGK